jgi:hypothetical protein
MAQNQVEKGRSILRFNAAVVSTRFSDRREGGHGSKAFRANGRDARETQAGFRLVRGVQA